MKATQIFQNGKVRAVITYYDDDNGGYVPDNPEHVVEGEPTTLLDYWDGSKWVTPSDAPSEYHYFDYDTKTWVDGRSLDEIKNNKWQSVLRQRNALEFGGFSYGGNVYDSSQVSQGRILGAAMANINQTWTLQNNESIELSANELKELFVAMQAHISLTHERSRTTRELIYSATTPEEVEAVNI